MDNKDRLMQIGELAKVSVTDEFKASVRTIPWNSFMVCVIELYMGILA